MIWMIDHNMDTDSDARGIADRALVRLIELRASQSPSIADVAAIASEVRVPSGSEFSSQPTANKARAEAWLAIRKIVRTLEGNNPGTNDLDAFWGSALDLTKIWQQAIDG
jgi:hypothetical protein